MRIPNLLVAIAAFALPLLVTALSISDTTSQSLSAFGKRDTISTILTDIEDLAECAGCEVRLPFIGLLLRGHYFSCRK